MTQSIAIVRAIATVNIRKPCERIQLELFAQAICLCYVRQYHNNTIKYSWYYMSEAQFIEHVQNNRPRQKKTISDLKVFLLFIYSSFIFHWAQRLQHFILCWIFFALMLTKRLLVQCANDDTEQFIWFFPST